MLDAVTKKYVDASTEEPYSFSFFCDCCGKVVSTTKLAFRPGFEKKLFLSRAEQRARELVWQRDHDSASVLYKDLGGEYLVFSSVEAFNDLDVMSVGMFRTKNKEEI